MNCELPLCDSSQDAGIIIDRHSSWESAQAPPADACTEAPQPWGISGCISSRGVGGGGYRRKQDEHLHIIIMSACKDCLLNYIPFKTFNEEEMRSTNYCGSVNFNCKSLNKTWGLHWHRVGTVVHVTCRLNIYSLPAPFLNNSSQSSLNSCCN